MAQTIQNITKGDRLALEKQAREASKLADQEENEQRINEHKLKVTRHTRAKQFKGNRKTPVRFSRDWRLMVRLPIGWQLSIASLFLWDCC